MLRNMKNRRLKLGLTQANLGKRVGIQQRRYSNYELGIRNMPVFVAKKIAKELNMNWWELYEE